MMNATTLTNDEINLRMHDTTWTALRYFNLYRVVISGLFTVLGFAGKLPPNLPEPDARLFTITASAYVILAVAAQFVIEQRRTHYRYQVYGLVVVDIIAITVLMHAAGGVTSGIGMLLIVSIGGACLLASGRAAVFRRAGQLRVPGGNGIRYALPGLFRCQLHTGRVARGGVFWHRGTRLGVGAARAAR